jgi:hypothetical protein
MAPGVTAEPDPRRFVKRFTFGGYRLGRRTNIRNIEMTPPATVAHVTAEAVTAKRYWTWGELRDGDATDDRELLERTRAVGAPRSPAVSAEPGRRTDAQRRSRQPRDCCRGIAATRRLRALTYGVPHADDVRIAECVARAGDAEWEFFPLYADGWLERRTNRILETDGLMDLVDLMHTEVLERLPSPSTSC